VENFFLQGTTSTLVVSGLKANWFFKVWNGLLKDRIRTELHLDWIGFFRRGYKLGFSSGRMVVFPGSDSCSWDQDLSVFQDLDN